jgi:hypothetical protein
MTPSIDSTLDSDNARALQPPTRSYVFGPALWMLGALIWAFTVAGEFTTAGIIGEGVAVLGVLGVTITAGIFAIRRQLDSMAKDRRLWGSTVAKTLGIFALLVLVVGFPLSVLQAGSDVGMTLLLLLIGVCVAWLGSRFTAPGKNPPRAALRLSLLAMAVVLSIATIVHVLAVN